MPLYCGIKRWMVPISQKEMANVKEKKKVKHNPYPMWGSQRKLLSDAMKANKSQTAKNRRKRTLVYESLIPTTKVVDVSKEKEKSETESNDVVAVVEKRQRQVQTIQTGVAPKEKKKKEAPKRRIKEKARRQKEKSSEDIGLDQESGSEEGPYQG